MMHSPSKLSRLLLRTHNTVRLYLARGPNGGIEIIRLKPRCKKEVVSTYYNENKKNITYTVRFVYNNTPL